MIIGQSSFNPKTGFNPDVNVARFACVAIDIK